MKIVFEDKNWKFKYYRVIEDAKLKQFILFKWLRKAIIAVLVMYIL